MGGETKPNMDEESRLKDKLKGKKMEYELREKLLTKKVRRNSENDTASTSNGLKKNGSRDDSSSSKKSDTKDSPSTTKDSPSTKGSPSTKDSPTNNSHGSRGRKSSDNKGSPNNNNNNNSRSDRNSDRRGSSSGGRELARRDSGGPVDRRSSSQGRDQQRFGDRGGRGGGGYGRGPPPPHWHRDGGRGRGGWGRGPHFEPDPYGRGPPPPFRGGGGRGDFRDGGGRGGYGPPPPHHRGGGGPPPYYDEDQYGRAPRNFHRRSRSASRSVSARRSFSSRSRSVSRSYSRSRSRSRSRSPSPVNGRRSGGSSGKRGRSEERSRGRRSNKQRRRRSRGRSRHSRSPSSSGSSISSSSSSSSSSGDESAARRSPDDNDPAANFTKDQRTVFVTQLVMRTTEKDIRRYFRRKVEAKVNDVILLKDRRTGKHKGCAYVEMKSMEDVAKALNVSGQAPDFQRFPLIVKPSEAEKNYLIPASSATLTADMMGGKTNSAPIIGPNGQLVEAQKVYVGSLDQSITQEHLYKLFSQFGDLTKVSLQMDASTGISKGFAFLSFRDPKEANLAIQTMSNQVLAGRHMKTGWATANGTPGLELVTSDEFPEDASDRAQRARLALSQLQIGAGMAFPVVTTTTSPSGAAHSAVPTVAEARQSLANSAASVLSMTTTTVTTPVTTPAATTVASPDAKVIGRADNPSQHVLIRNMFDKDEETEAGWAEEIKEEFKEECSKFGKIEFVLVMSNDPGGKIYASFDTVEGAKNCASSLAGRWFDKRQLQVEFVDADQIPKQA